MSVFIPIPKKGNAKECSNYHTTTLISQASKIMLKNSPSKASTVCEQYVKFQIFKLKRQRNQRLNFQHHWIIEKAREFQKNIYFCLLTMPKPLTVSITTNCGKF